MCFLIDFSITVNQGNFRLNEREFEIGEVEKLFFNFTNFDPFCHGENLDKIFPIELLNSHKCCYLEFETKT